MNNPDSTQRKVFVSFSGIDGAGKSTQIDALSSRLRRLGICVLQVRFWDDIARLKGIREASGHKLFKGDKGVGSPAAPINRRDKNVQSPVMTCIRLFLYFVDALSTRRTVQRAFKSDADLVIFDRYTYDELANLNLRNPFIRLYVRFIMLLAPQPDISYILDADPAQARARKPEYPLEFLETNRNAYLTLSRLVPGMSVISPSSVDEAQAEVLRIALRVLSSNSAFAADLIERASIMPLTESANIDEPHTRQLAS